MALQPARGGQHVLAGFALVEGLELRAGGVFVAGVTADRQQGVGREGKVARQRHAPGHVLDVRIQAAVFVDHQHKRQRPGFSGGADQVAAGLAVAHGRFEARAAGRQPRIVGFDLPGLDELRGQRRQQPGGPGDAGGKTSGGLQEAATVQLPVHVAVEQLQHFGMEILRGLAAHGRLPGRFWL